MKQVRAFTDVACSGNPGPGGWGAVLQFGDHEREIYGGAADTTNNRMELSAAIEALSTQRALPSQSDHRFHLCERRHHSVAGQLETQWLEDCR